MQRKTSASFVLYTLLLNSFERSPVTEIPLQSVAVQIITICSRGIEVVKKGAPIILGWTPACLGSKGERRFTSNSTSTTLLILHLKLS